MVKSLKLRAIDQEAFSRANSKDYKNRVHRSTKQKLFERFLGLVAVILGTILLVYLKTLIGAFICLIAGLSLLVHALQIQKYQTILERSEFLNALLSSATAEGYKFTSIVTSKDGQIVYLNNGFQKLFPEVVSMEKRTLSKLLSTYKIDKTKTKSILDAVKKHSKKSVKLDFVSGKKKTSVQVSIEPIARPSGFVLVRGV